MSMGVMDTSVNFFFTSFLVEAGVFVYRSSFCVLFY